MSAEYHVFERMRDLKLSDEWKEFVRVLADHKDELQKESNQHLRKGNHVDSRISLAKMDDTDKWIRLFVDKLAVFKKNYKQ